MSLVVHEATPFYLRPGLIVERPRCHLCFDDRGLGDNELSNLRLRELRNIEEGNKEMVPEDHVSGYSACSEVIPKELAPKTFTRSFLFHSRFS
jgi:hypothetical protein